MLISKYRVISPLNVDTDSSERMTSTSSSWTDGASWPQGVSPSSLQTELHEVTNAELGLAEDHFSSPEVNSCE